MTFDFWSVVNNTQFQNEAAAENRFSRRWIQEL